MCDKRRNESQFCVGPLKGQERMAVVAVITLSKNVNTAHCTKRVRYNAMVSTK